MSKKTSSKKTSSKKTASKKTAAPRRPTMSERADAAARAAEALEASNESAVEFTGKTRAFAGAWLPPKKTTKKADTPKAEKAPRVTVTSVAEDLIRDGKTDEQVLEALTKQFPDFDPVAKKHYPSWYRARLVRSGQITAEFANAHRHAKPSRDIPARAEA